MITLGPLSFPILPLLLMAGLLSSLVVSSRNKAQAPQIDSAVYTISLVGVLAARLGFVLLHWTTYAQTPVDILDIRDGGFFPVLGIGGSVLVIGWYLLRRPLQRRALLLPLLVGACVAGLIGFTVRMVKPPVEMSLPATVLSGLDGNPIRLDRFRGKPVVVNLWATWCPPCRREMPFLQRAQTTMPGVVFVFANQGEAPATVQQYLETEHIAITNVIFDRKLEIARLAGSNALPTTLFFDANGKLRGTKMGALSAATLAEALQGIVQ